MVNGSGHGCVNRPGVQLRLIEGPIVDGTHMTVVWMTVVMRATVPVLPEVPS